jgi:hypothetical protein
LRKEKEEAFEKLWIAQQETYDLRAKFEEEKKKIQNENDHLLVE